MKGTEKQINWASEIINRLDGVLDQIVTNIPDECPQEQKDMMSTFVEQLRSRIHGADYAGDIIDLFKNVKTTNNLMGMWRITRPATPGQHKILGR